MNIALIGYGKMGHEVETVALKRGHQIALIIDQNNVQELTKENLKRVDVAIEFTTPETAFENVSTCLKCGTPIVCGTTGWDSKLEDAKKILSETGGTLFHASNFSIGVNIFFLINKILSQKLNEIGGYGVTIEEIHHTKKKDAPSGTAITLANIISNELSYYKGWTLLPNIHQDSIPINSVREGEIPGTHTANYNSDQDEIILTHRAKSRKGFAIGAVLAAEFSLGKKGFLTMDSFLGI
jgi:4-hydroxy-tetrahydrodipicolinate reductase